MQPQKFKCFLLIFAIILVTTVASRLQAQNYSPARYSALTNVGSFAITPDQHYFVFSLLMGNRFVLYESAIIDGLWTELTPISAINDFEGGNSQIGGPAFNYNGTILYYHANFPGGIGGYDIYYSVRDGDSWSEPINMGYPINSLSDEFYPFMGVGENRFFMSRANPDAELRKPRRAPDCNFFLVATKGVDGRWTSPVPLHDAINMGCVYSLSLANDGKTIYFSAVDQNNHRDGYNIYYAREMFSGAWTLPSLLPGIASENNNVDPRIIGDKIYFLELDSRRGNVGSIYRASLPEMFHPLPTIKTSGYILKLGTDEPVAAELVVFDPTTLKIFGTFRSDINTGKYEMVLPDENNYIVDVRKHGFSFASFDLDFRYEEKVHGPDTIRLFDNANLVVSVYDREIFRPLEADVWVEVVSEDKRSRGIDDKPDDVDDSARIYADMKEPGIYLFTLPMGKEYVVNAKAIGFYEDNFSFDLMDDIIFAEFHRNISLEPIKREVEFFIADAETAEGVQAEIIIRNLNREETIFFSAQDVRDGKVTAMLREGDEYEFTVRGAQGYSFHNQTFNLGDEAVVSMDVELVPLRAKTSIRLNNIYFASNSADLTAESFSELDRVVDLLSTNPLIEIEISAHTDNIGSDGFNMLLSERRARSVLNYLLDNEVPEDRLVAKGYGLRKPLVPNVCDESRAMNRRVEFTIIEIREE